MLQHYPPNSSEAAAQVLALAMLSDGDINWKELQALERWKAHEQLGMSREAFLNVVLDTSLGLLDATGSDWSRACRLDPVCLQSLMTNISQPELRAKVLALCVDVIEADHWLADGEAEFLKSALQGWVGPPALGAACHAARAVI